MQDSVTSDFGIVTDAEPAGKTSALSLIGRGVGNT